LLQAQHHLPRAQTAIDENLAVIGRDQRAVPRAPAPEHGQAEHGSQDSRVISLCANGNNRNHEATNDEGRPGNAFAETFQEAVM